MQTETFVTAVREASGIDTQQHASQAVMATVEVLADRFAEAVRELAATLPVEMQSRMASEPETDQFPLATFYDRVGAVEGNGCVEAEVRRHVRATMHELRKTLRAEFNAMFDRLPPGYGDIVDSLEETLPARVAKTAREVVRPLIPRQRRPVHDQ